MRPWCFPPKVIFPSVSLEKKDILAVLLSTGKMGNDILKKLKIFFDFVNGFPVLCRMESERHSANTQNMGRRYTI